MVALLKERAQSTPAHSDGAIEYADCISAKR